MCYLPLLEPRSNVEEDDDDFLQDAPEEHHVDLVVPFKKSVIQIIREVCSTYVCHLFYLLFEFVLSLGMLFYSVEDWK